MVRASKNSKYFDKSEVIGEFYNNYAKIVAPILDALEQRRRKYLFMLSALVLVLPLLVIILYPLLGSAVFLLGVLGLIFPSVMLISRFTHDLKCECMPFLIQAFGNMKWCSNTFVISDYDLRESELFAVFNTRNDDDSFVGKYKGVEYKVSEMYLANVSGSGKRKMYWRVFNGVVILFDSNKEIKNKTIITTKGDINTRNRNPLLYMFLAYILFQFVPYFFHPKYFFNTVFPFLIAFIVIAFLFLKLLERLKLSNKEQLNEIKLEDPKFCKTYRAFSSDEVEGRYLITTAFMERFQNLHTAFGTRRAKCSFYDDKVMFSISTEKNLFELGSFFTPVNNQKAINRFLAEISAIFDLIDYFKLDEKTGI